MTRRETMHPDAAPGGVSAHAPGLFARAKWAFTTRRVDRAAVAGLTPALAAAQPGDLVLARVERIGSHRNLQLAAGRACELYPGDLIVAACGARYAPDQYEGVAELDPDGADLLAGGGIVGRLRARNARMPGPTRVAPLGLRSGADGAPVNLRDHALARRARPSGLVTIAAVGAAMNAAKTTALAALAHGLARAGFAVAAIKATGTGASGDHNACVDVGADWVGDFVDAGMASTYLARASRIAAALDTLLGHAAGAGARVALVEVADGIFQRETAELLRAEGAGARFDGRLFAAPDAASAAGGLAVLRGWGLRADMVTGLLSRSPMAAAETAAATGLPVATRGDLCDPAYAGAFLARLGGTDPAMPRTATAGGTGGIAA